MNKSKLENATIKVIFLGVAVIMSVMTYQVAVECVNRLLK
jgi:hypothetical protein